LRFLHLLETPPLLTVVRAVAGERLSGGGVRGGSSASSSAHCDCGAGEYDDALTF